MSGERRCILHGQPRPKDDLIRFVRAPDGQVVPDLKCELPGRGVWVTADYQSVKEVENRDLFSKAFKARVIDGSDLAKKTGDLLMAAALSWLSLAVKSGSLVSGRAKVEKAIHKGHLALLIEANDASEDGKKKLRSLKKAFENETGQKSELISTFSIEQLSLALGRENVVHAAITNKQMALKFHEVVSRLETYQQNQDKPDEKKIKH